VKKQASSTQTKNNTNKMIRITSFSSLFEQPKGKEPATRCNDYLQMINNHWFAHYKLYNLSAQECYDYGDRFICSDCVTILLTIKHWRWTTNEDLKTPCKTFQVKHTRMHTTADGILLTLLPTMISSLVKTFINTMIWSKNHPITQCFKFTFVK